MGRFDLTGEYIFTDTGLRSNPTEEEIELYGYGRQEIRRLSCIDNGDTDAKKGSGKYLKLGFVPCKIANLRMEGFVDSLDFEHGKSHPDYVDDKIKAGGGVVYTFTDYLKATTYYTNRDSEHLWLNALSLDL
jgi:hypothetical protein